MARFVPADTAGLLRLGLLVLAALGIAGTAIELVFLKHWGGITRSMVWPGMLALAVGLVLLVARPRPATIRAVQVLCLLVLVIAAMGIWFHVEENLLAGALDRSFGDTWDARSGLDQLWLAITAQVGSAPTLAPGALAEIALALLLATVHHPALGRHTAGTAAPR